MLAILFYFDGLYLLNFLILALSAWAIYKICIQNTSTYLLVSTVLYVYIGFSFVVLNLLSFDSMSAIYLIVIYFILSGLGLIMFFKYLQKKIKPNDCLF